MANTYDTSNEPLGSPAVKVLYNNASNMDDAVNSDADTWVDRPPFGRIRRTWRGMENSFDQFLAGSAFELPPLVYADGSPLQVDRATQLIERADILYSVRLPSSFPVTLSGNWAADAPLLTVRSDQALRQELASSTGVSLINGGDLSAGNIRSPVFAAYNFRSLGDIAGDYLRLDHVDALVPEDPSVDNGPVLNAILAVAAQNNVPVSGNGATFYTRTTILVESNIRLFRCNFVSMGAASGDTSEKSHISVISATGDNMYFEDVHVDGSRQLWPNISMTTPGPEGGGGEDGGMHAWRLPGAVTNSSWVRCSGNNAGTAGWALHNPNPSTTASTFVKSNLNFRDCDGVGNREHGMFADSFDGISWEGGKLTGNGLDLNTIDPLYAGTRAARSGGLLFGAAFDVEAYGPNFLGSMFTRFKISGVDCTGNAIMPLIYNPIASSLPGFAPFRDLQVLDCLTDTGKAPDDERLAATIGLAFRVYSNADGADTVVNPVIRIHQKDGHGEFISVTDLDHSSGFVGDENLKARLIAPRGSYDLSCAGKSNTLQIVNNEPIPTFSVAAGAATVSPTLRRFAAAPNSSVDVYYDLTLDVSTSPCAVLITPPTGYRVAVSSSVSLTTPAGVPAAAALLLNVGGTATLWTPSGQSSGTLVLRLEPF
ncbi:MAG: structural protein [Caudoviricetes sp.]|nr:MAG: structural protein [Caudoviricetes sp.]